MVFPSSWLTVLALVALFSPSLLSPVAAHSHHIGSLHGSHNHFHGSKLATRLKVKGASKRTLVSDRVFDGAPAPSTNAQRFQRGMGPKKPIPLLKGVSISLLLARA